MSTRRQPLARTPGGMMVSRPSSPPLARLQTKLPVSEPGDASEREADRVAETVVQGGTAAVGERGAPALHRKCKTGCECADCSRKVQRQALPGGSAAAAAPTADIGLGSGRHLPEGVRGFFESRLVHDFGDVRIHTDD